MTENYETTKSGRQSVNSSNSSNSNASAFLTQNERLILKYPDGTFAYAWKGCPKSKGGGDTWLKYKTSRIMLMKVL